MATGSLIYFPKQSNPASKKHSKEKCTVLEWIRSGWLFPGAPNPEPPKPDENGVPFPVPPPPKPKPNPEPEPPASGGV